MLSQKLPCAHLDIGIRQYRSLVDIRNSDDEPYLEGAHNLLLERVIATKRVATYEECTTAISYTLVLMSLSAALLLSIVKQRKYCMDKLSAYCSSLTSETLNDVIYIHLFLFVMLIITMIVFGLLFSLNRKIRCRITHDVSKKYQASENLRALRLLSPLLIFHFIGYPLYFVISVVLLWLKTTLGDLTFRVSFSAIYFPSHYCLLSTLILCASIGWTIVVPQVPTSPINPNISQSVLEGFMLSQKLSCAYLGIGIRQYRSLVNIRNFDDEPYLESACNLLLERVIATKRVATYEECTTAISYTLVLMSLSVALMLSIVKQHKFNMNKLSVYCSSLTSKTLNDVIYVHSFLFVMLIVTMIVFGRLFFLNMKIRSRIAHDVSEKYQASENLRALRLLSPLLIFHFIGYPLYFAISIVLLWVKKTLGDPMFRVSFSATYFPSHYCLLSTLILWYFIRKEKIQRGKTAFLSTSSGNRREEDVYFQNYNTLWR
ncbi:hypothetical protein GCK32_007709 [Trichostrongylus colubriformis]|uniref:Uncharacterized protein n=1 Tax=Trichostrongylus colubriformis TaxID=6319 RepID=A0AAN8G2U9_TRICO